MRERSNGRVDVGETFGDLDIMVILGKSGQVVGKKTHTADTVSTIHLVASAPVLDL